MNKKEPKQYPKERIENLVNGCMSIIKPDGTLEPIHDEDLEMLTKGM